MFRLRLVEVLLIVASFGLLAQRCARAEVRSIDGSENNLTNTQWGAANSSLLRICPADYLDDMGGMILSPLDRENARIISNAVASQSGEMPNHYGLSNMAWQWGQFIDHDMSLTDAHASSGSAPIATAPGDVLGPNPIPFTRSVYEPGTGVVPGAPRQQMNSITSFLDASMVYGSDASRASWLREGVGGRLKTSADQLLPFNDGTQTVAGMGGAPSNSADLFVAGDNRASEQVGLSAMHTVFVREHNRLAGLLASAVPGASDEEIYQSARRIVGAEIQSITYNEFLPAFLGGAELPAYTGYRSDVNPSIANEFSTALFRVGHTMLSTEFRLLESDGSSVESIDLRDSYFNPAFFEDAPENIDRVLRGLPSRAQEIDHHLIDDVRNFLFGPPGAGGMDLAALNLQRGRDHGLADYNTTREAYGLLAKETFLTDGLLLDGVTPNGVTSDSALALQLESMYGSVDNIDLWIGALAEDHLAASGIGELLTTGIIEQFARLRDGDRFFYLNDPELSSPEILAVIDLDSVSLRDIIEWNTDARFGYDNLFMVAVPEPSSIIVLLLTLGGLAIRAASRPSC